MALVCAFHFLSLLAYGQETPEITVWQAASEGDIEAIEAHISADTDLNEKHTTGYAPLHYAVMQTQTEVVALLLEEPPEKLELPWRAS